MGYEAELFGREFKDESPISGFYVRIVPPVPGARELVKEYFDDDYYASTIMTSTQNATVLQVEMFGSDIHSDDDPRLEDSMRTNKFPYFRTHEQRTKIFAGTIRNLLEELNAMDDLDSQTWASGERINLDNDKDT